MSWDTIWAWNMILIRKNTTLDRDMSTGNIKNPRKIVEV